MSAPGPVPHAWCIALATALLLEAAPPAGAEALPASGREEAARVAAGRALVLDRTRGNCLACHAIAGAGPAGDVGPSLDGVARRHADRAALRAQVSDAARFHPETLMPPYGRHGLLGEAEIDLVVDFLMTL